jgi:hypothetical protein
MTETLKEFAASIGLIRSAALGTAVLISVGFGARQPSLLEHISGGLKTKILDGARPSSLRR